MTVNHTLTHFERNALKLGINLADGHAYHELHQCFDDIIKNLSDIWFDSTKKQIPDIEHWFLEKWGELAGSTTMSTHDSFLICPAASNSIDIIAAYLSNRRLKTALITPCFDNLPLLLKRRKVDLIPIREEIFDSFSENEDEIHTYLLKHGCKSLFLVSPNNPTGFIFDINRLAGIANICERVDIVLIVDVTFNFYNRSKYDYHKLLSDSGVKYILIEDSGKSFPTQDMKASIILFHRYLLNDLKEIYEEIFLCTSPFTLELIGRLVERTSSVGLKTVLWDEVDQRREELYKVIDPSPLTPLETAEHPFLPIEYLNCSKSNLSDLEFEKYCWNNGLGVLPGRYFFWDNSKELGHDFIRIGFMKKKNVFKLAMKRLENILDEWK